MNKIINKEKFNQIKDELIDITMSCDHKEALHGLNLILESENKKSFPDIYILKACEELITEIKL